MQQMLKLGASGYLLKRSAAGELIRAIRTVAGGGNYLDPAVVQDMVGDLFDNKAVAPDVSKVVLSDREREVIRLIAQGFTNKEIAIRLDISPKTVETYKSRSMAKLDLRGRTDLVRFVIRSFRKPSNRASGSSNPFLQKCIRRHMKSGLRGFFAMFIPNRRSLYGRRLPQPTAPSRKSGNSV